MTHLNHIGRLIILGVCIFWASGNAFAQQKETIVPVDPLKTDANRPVERIEAIKNSDSVLLRLGQAHFDPLLAVPEGSEMLNRIETFSSDDVGYYIVQFDGPIKNSWKTQIAGMGGELFDYLPDFAFVMRMKAGSEPAVRSHPHVRWLGIYQPAYRISRSALEKAWTDETDVAERETPSVTVMVSLFPGEDLTRIRSAMEALGGDILDTAASKRKTVVKVTVRADKLVDVPAIPGVKWVEPEPEWTLYNNQSTDVMNVRTAWDSHGLYGLGQTVAVCDTGIDQGVTAPANLHDDFEDGLGGSRILQIFDRVGDGANDVNTGHGTHVAGSVLGNGAMSGSDPSLNDFPATSFAGIAPQANLIFQAVEENTTGVLLGLPSNLDLLFSEADTAGADLHSNSWGSSMAAAYTSFSEDVDAYVWDHPDFLILFAAGNSGVDLDGDGVIDYYNVGSPGTAKNCLTVGASEGDRPTGAGYDCPWGTGSWALKYPADPIFSDHVSDNTDGMAAFSSRGPVLDGRYKPDLVAPGTNILSVKSSHASGSGWGPYDNDYMWMGGTSMSTPLTAGASALMRQYLIDEKGVAAPSAALLKAALLNSAADISPGQYGTGPDLEIPDGVPNNVLGWGRLNLAEGIYPASPFNILYYDGAAGLNTGDDEAFDIHVSDPGQPLKINLVWSDYPGSPVTQGGLVNDLDLQVTDPLETVHYADNASQQPTVSSLIYDSGYLAYIASTLKRAMRFTPSSYPVNVESTTVYFYNDADSTSDVDIVVYDDDGAGGLPGTELFRKTLTYVPSSWVTIGITGVAISSGDFYIAVEKIDESQSIVVDDSNPTGRSYYYNGSAWAVSGYTAFIRANVRDMDYATSFDRVNNVVGVSIDSAPPGTYTVRVSGYNVPYGPQPYAMVVSGNCATGVEDPPEIDSIDFNGCLSELCTTTISVTAEDPAGGPLTYDWTELNGPGGLISSTSGSSVVFDPPDSGPYVDPYQIMVSVTSDASGLSVSETIDITVKLAGDANSDGLVNILDKVMVRNAFGSSGVNPADVNCDNVVNILDKVIVRNQFGMAGNDCP